MKYSSITNNKSKRAVFSSMIVAVFAQLYFFPIESDLKISIGIIVLGIILLMEDEITPLYISFLSGIFVVIIRCFISVLAAGMDIPQSIIRHFPTIFFYITFGLLINLSKKYLSKNLITNVLIFMAVDMLSNICESLVRKDINIAVIKTIIISAVIRSLVTNIIFQAYSSQKLFILNSEHQDRYTQLNIMLSNIHAEIFYLKKSTKDINNVMSKSYNMYEKFKSNPEICQDALDISREIHEIRKDYDRVLKGFESLIDSVEKEDTLMLSSIFDIIQNNTDRIISQNCLKVHVTFCLDEDYEITSYYNLFAVLNNLIVNAIDACESGGTVKISTKSHEDDILFIIDDNGKGMEIDIVPYIFQPGFTTKFNEVTGTGSTGIGLYHVKNIVESLGGVIDVISRPMIGTKFVVTIPKNSL